MLSGGKRITMGNVIVRNRNRLHTRHELGGNLKQVAILRLRTKFRDYRLGKVTP